MGSLTTNEIKLSDALLRLNDLILQDLPFNQLTDKILQFLLEYVQVSKSAIYIFQPKLNLLVMYNQRGLPVHSINKEIEQKYIQKLVEYDKGIIDIYNQNGNLSGLFEQFYNTLTDMKTVFWIPLVGQNKFLGILSIGQKFNIKPFSEDDKKVLVMTGRLLAKTIYTSALFDSIRKRNDQFRKQNFESERVNSMLRNLVTGSHRDVPVEKILHAAINITNSAKGMLLIRQIDSDKFVSTVYYETAQKIKELPIDDPVAADISTEAQPLILNDPDSQMLRHLFSAVNFLVIPIFLETVLRAIVIVADKSNHGNIIPYGESDLIDIQILTGIAEVELYDYFYHENLNRQLKIQQNMLELLPFGMMYFDQQGSIKIANILITRMMNKSKEELVGKSFREIFDQDEEVLKAIDQSVTSSISNLVKLNSSNTIPDSANIVFKILPVILEDERGFMLMVNKQSAV